MPYMWRNFNGYEFMGDAQLAVEDNERNTNLGKKYTE